jgi:hypothetical protein
MPAHDEVEARMEREDGRGLTLASLSATLLGVLLTAVLTQIYDIVVGVSFSSEHTLALPAVWSALVLAGVSAIGLWVGRTRWLNRAELTCALYAMLIAAPLTTQGFWHRAVAILATHPRMGDFEKLDAMSDRLWPHGPNRLSGALDGPGRCAAGIDGTYGWEQTDIEDGQRGPVAVLENRSGDSVARLRVRLPLRTAGRPDIAVGEPYLISVLARARDLGPNAFYFCRVYGDDDPVYREWFRSSAAERPSVIHKTGFQRAGAYGVRLPDTATNSVAIEFGLSGTGRLQLRDPKFFSVGALEGVYRGRRLVTREEWAAVPPAERPGTVVRPDRLASVEGLRFLLAGYIPVRDWAGPVAVWTAFVGLLLLATFAVNVIVRRQWMEGERFLMPVAQIPLALFDDGGDNTRTFAPVWRHRVMWAGFAVTLAWMLLKAWHRFNPKVPDVSISVPLKPYFSDPGWGGTWERVRFEIDPIFLAAGAFMDLSVLLTLVVGFFLFRLQFWVGHVTGWTANPNFPCAAQQTIGAYLAYALVVLAFARRYLWGVLRAAMGRAPPSDPARDEAGAYRFALLTLALCGAGLAAWAGRLGLSVVGMMVFFAFLVSIGLVASRLRTECGTPWGYYTPANFTLFLLLMGGIARFGPETILFGYLASFMLAPTVFFQIPGTQMELLEIGRRWRVPLRHLFVFCALGVLGGMVIGGWVFLSNAYALGGNSMRYQWAFEAKPWYFFSFNQELIRATQAHLGQAGSGAGGGAPDPAWVAAGLAAFGTALVAVLRQFFAGFWFHPVGLVLGATNFMDYVWGSAFAAWVVRASVLRLSGAAAMRNRVQPFFVGVFLGAATAYLLFGVHGAWLHAIGIEGVAPTLSPP